jgi:hypothetical protein
MGWPGGEDLGVETLECTPLKVSGSNSPGATSCVGPIHTKRSSGFKWTPLQVDGGIGVLGLDTES